MHVKAVANILHNKWQHESYQAIFWLKGIASMKSISQFETSIPTGPLLYASQTAIEQQNWDCFLDFDVL